MDVIPQIWAMDFTPPIWGIRGWKRNRESKLKKHITIMNLCFKNMGIIHTSARESWITRLWEKRFKIHVWINCVRPRECSLWRFWESNFQFPFSGGACPRTPLPPLYNSCIRGWHSVSSFQSSNLELNVQLQENSIPIQNEWWYRVWMKQKFERRRKLLSQSAIKSLVNH